MFHRELLVAAEPIAERLALHVGHDVVEQPGGGTGIMERENVGMTERGGDVDFAEKPLGAERGRQLRTQDLERDPPVVLEVLGQIDRCHPAPAELALDRVAVREGGADLDEPRRPASQSVGGY